MGCSSAHIYSENSLEKVSALQMTCSKPFLLTKDCIGGFGFTIGPDKLIKLEGYEMKVASSANDKIILVIDYSPQPQLFESSFTL